MKYKFKLLDPHEWTIDPETLQSFDERASFLKMTKENAEFTVHTWLATGCMGMPVFALLSQAGNANFAKYSSMRIKRPWWKPDFRGNRTVGKAG